LSVILRVVIFSALICLAACTTTTTLPRENLLDAGARQHIKTVDGVLIIRQNQIDVDLGFNVFTVAETRAKRLIKPIQDRLEGYDYVKAFESQFKQSMGGTVLDGIGNFKVIRHEFTKAHENPRNETYLQDALRELSFSDSKADAVLVVVMKYAFSVDFEAIYVESQGMLFPNNEELMSFQETSAKNKRVELSDNIYRNQYSAYFPANLTAATRVENAAYWSELSEEKLVEILETAGLLLADSYARDIGIDDVKSDLNLVPHGYVLNSKYSNLNEYSKTRHSGTTANTTAQPDNGSSQAVVSKGDPEN